MVPSLLLLWPREELCSTLDHACTWRSLQVQLSSLKSLYWQSCYPPQFSSMWDGHHRQICFLLIFNLYQMGITGMHQSIPAQELIDMHQSL